MAPPDPKPSTRPQPIGDGPTLVLLTTCVLCILFLLWRRAESLRHVVAHRLKSLRQPSGQIRLSMDDGPPANEFLSDDYDNDASHILDDEPLAAHIRVWREPRGVLLPKGQAPPLHMPDVNDLPAWPNSVS